ncbi:hypothetical protein V6Z11_A10G125500 [Gossypium hirsutum]
MLQMSLLSDMRRNTSNARRKVQQDILVLVHHLLSARLTNIWVVKISCMQRMQDLQRSASENGDGS